MTTEHQNLRITLAAQDIFNVPVDNLAAIRMAVIADMEVGANTEPNKIIDVIAKEFGVMRAEIQSPTRKREVVRARYACCFLLYRTGMTLKEVGKCLGDRDHSTISNGISEFHSLNHLNTKYNEKITRCEALIAAIN